MSSLTVGSLKRSTVAPLQDLLQFFLSFANFSWVPQWQHNILVYEPIFNCLLIIHFCHNIALTNACCLFKFIGRTACLPWNRYAIFHQPSRQVFDRLFFSRSEFCSQVLWIDVGGFPTRKRQYKYLPVWYKSLLWWS